MKKYFFSLLSMALFFSSCKDKPIKDIIDKPKEELAELVLEFKGKYNGNNFVMKNTKINTNNCTTNIELLKFYLSNITLIKNNGTEVLAKDVALINFENNHNTNNNIGEIITLSIEPDNYVGVKFGFGVDNNKNNEDPTTYAEGQPLSVYEGMHWSWNTGYIFYKLEGKYDTILNATSGLTKSFFFHVGLNDLYTTKSFTKNFSLSAGDTSTLRFNIDMQKAFTTSSLNIDLRTENFTHTTGQIPLAIKARDLFLEAITLE